MDISGAEQTRVRREKVAKMRAAGRDPYPLGYPRTTSTAEVRLAHPDLVPDQRSGNIVGITGRLMLNRIGVAAMTAISLLALFLYLRQTQARFRFPRFPAYTALPGWKISPRITRAKRNLR